MRIECKVGIAGDGERVHGEGIEILGRFDLRRWRAVAAYLCETVRNIEDKDDECAVGWAFDFKVAKERIGAEQIQRFVDDVRLRCFR